jgi:hypothetical protein
MTMFGLSWGLRLERLDPVSKLVAIRLGDGCDTYGRGNADIQDLIEWCCADRKEIFAALQVLAFKENVAWSANSDGGITYSLPPQARPMERERPAQDNSQSAIYIMRGRLGRKIGISKNVAVRLDGVRLATLDDGIALEWHIEERTPVIRKAERIAHIALAEHLVRNEWFSVSLEDAMKAVTMAVVRAREEFE